MLKKLRQGWLKHLIYFFIVSTHDRPPPKDTAMLLFLKLVQTHDHTWSTKTWFKPMIHHLFQIVFTCSHWNLFCLFLFTVKQNKEEKNTKNCRPGTILKKISQGWFKHLIYLFLFLWFKHMIYLPPTTLQCRCLKHLHKYEFVRWKTAMLLFKTWFKHMIYQTNWFKTHDPPPFSDYLYLLSLILVLKTWKTADQEPFWKKNQGWFKHLIYLFLFLWFKHMIYLPPPKPCNVVV